MPYVATIVVFLMVLSSSAASAVPLGVFSQQEQSNDAFHDFMAGLENYNGWGDTAQSYAEAMQYFKSAARSGHTQAQHYVGLMYYKAQGVEKDNIEAYVWFDLAASNGDKVGIVLKLTLKDILTAEQIQEAERRKNAWLVARSED